MLVDVFGPRLGRFRLISQQYWIDELFQLDWDTLYILGLQKALTMKWIRHFSRDLSFWVTKFEAGRALNNGWISLVMCVAPWLRHPVQSRPFGRHWLWLGSDFSATICTFLISNFVVHVITTECSRWLNRDIHWSIKYQRFSVLFPQFLSQCCECVLRANFITHDNGTEKKPNKKKSVCHL